MAQCTCELLPTCSAEKTNKKTTTTIKYRYQLIRVIMHNKFVNRFLLFNLFVNYARASNAEEDPRWLYDLKLRFLRFNGKLPDHAEEIWGYGTPKVVDKERYLDAISCSTEDLAKVYSVEQNLLKKLEVFAKQTDKVESQCEKESKKSAKTFKNLQNKLSDILKFFMNDDVSSFEFVNNPINMYILIKRLAIILPKKIKALKSFQAPFKNLKCTKNLKFPVETVKEFPKIAESEYTFGAPLGILNIEMLSKLEISNFTDNIYFPGEIVESKFKLKAEDFELISNVAGGVYQFEKQVAWAEAALIVAKRDKSPEKEIRRLEKLITKLKVYHDEFIMEEGLTAADLDHDNVYFTNIEPFDKKLLDTEEYIAHRNNFDDLQTQHSMFENSYVTIKNRQEKNHRNFSLGIRPAEITTAQLVHFLQPAVKTLCRGDEITPRPPNLDKPFKCFLLHHFGPFLILNPFKIEIINLIPFIYKTHDFYSEEEMRIFQSVSKGQMKTSPIPINNNKTELYSKHRTSKIFYASDATHPTMKESSRRLELMTGLRVIGNDLTSQNYQIMNYGIGGGVRMHTDSVTASSMPEFIRNQNILTILAYLSGPIKGGRTVFPQLGRGFAPEKGSLLVYINFRSDLRLDSRVTHQGCPVVSGHKWISTKWIRWIPQMFHLPCYRQKGTDIDVRRSWKQLGQIV